MKRAAMVRRVAPALMALIALWSLAARAAPHDEQVSAGQETREETDAPPAPMNWTQFGAEAPPFIAMLINFAIMAAGYYLLAKRPITAALQSRRDTIAKSIEEARRMKEEAEQRAKTYQAKLQRLEEDARAAREALLRVGEAERQRIVAEAEAKAERIRRDTEFALEQELKQLRVDLWKGAVDAAIAAATEILKQKVTLADQERLAEGYLAELGAPQSATAARGQETAP